MSTYTPLSHRTVTRILAALVVVLALLAGYFNYSLSMEEKKYLRLEDRYVRVRGELGIDETQRLIDQSRQGPTGDQDPQ